MYYIRISRYLTVARCRKVSHCPTLSNCYAKCHTAVREPEMVQAVHQEVWAYQQLQLPEPSGNGSKNAEKCRKDQRKMFSDV